MSKICFLSTDDLSGYVSDDELAVVPLGDLGYAAETLSWRQTERPWNEFAAVVIRTPWDYQRTPKEFLAVLAEITAHTRLENPLDIIEWNLDKHYLSDMSERGVDIVPTLWPTEYSRDSFAEWLSASDSGEVVIKPTVSATAENTFRLAEYDDALGSIFASREFMVQPFVASIVDEGEFSLFYFAGEYSHAIVKRPKTGDFRVQEEHGGIITAIRPDAGLRAACDSVVRAIGKTLLYARVDLVKFNGSYALMELELIEPSLYLRMDTDAPRRFAAAVDKFLG